MSQCNKINFKKFHQKMKRKKAQVFTTDFFMALFIFSILIVVVMISWNNCYSRINEKAEYNNLMNKAFQLSNVLVKNEGYPSNWTSKNVQIIGLASNDRNLSAEKVNAFVGLPLNKTGDIFQTFDYNFYFILKDFDDTILKEYGINPVNVIKSVSIRRYVLYNNAEAIFELMLWK